MLQEFAEKHLMKEMGPAPSREMLEEHYTPLEELVTEMEHESVQVGSFTWGGKGVLVSCS